ncbi:zinc finger BED domain-containing protein 3-like [Artibeus jamaicensis]|uniref:zinc finger BED domain-containing protein 3-like n=1 Tax=Artibeus jamaicensis TaxID=9417 RepID=UPI00235A7680|nr:zinc finger BED domain-containing protein 3-like [Artibeus jamaicensis]
METKRTNCRSRGKAGVLFPPDQLGGFWAQGWGWGEPPGHPGKARLLRGQAAVEARELLAPPRLSRPGASAGRGTRAAPAVGSPARSPACPAPTGLRGAASPRGGRRARGALALPPSRQGRRAPAFPPCRVTAACSSFRRVLGQPGRAEWAADGALGRRRLRAECAVRSAGRVAGAAPPLRLPALLLFPEDTRERRGPRPAVHQVQGTPVDPA